VYQLASKLHNGLDMMPWLIAAFTINYQILQPQTWIRRF